uniref:Uncharacterized protein n=1 Tax=Proboscia inermis TaxID=420281 RepID=A0A7S0C2L9_9STRA|mmetsp:Transcript_21639/g.22007  ORF Transcript_21639/g.22007 Transcript_21639/m.22007 type:complete len:214 (+) Transcript_21639:122-763(+)
MKAFSISLCIILQMLPSIHSFSYPKVSSSSVRQSLSLGATIDDNRRVFLGKSLASSTAAILAFMPVEEAMAKDIFVPTYDDIKVFYALGVTLDNLATSAGNPDTFSKALEGIVVFNKSPNFYNTFARSFISKSVKNNADGDPRVGKIRLASSQISSLQELLGGRQGLTGQDAAKEAVKRVRNAQALIASFLSESGVQNDERVNAFIKAHPLKS